MFDEAPPIDPGATLIVTRPQPEADALCDALRARGRDAFAYPVLAIEPAADQQALRAAMRRVDDDRLVVFVSPNAIRHALAARAEPWPSATTIGVMGPGSRATLVSLGFDVASIVSPAADAAADGESGERFDSESLFAALDAKLGLTHGFDGRVLIVRGNGGRAWLADRLRSIGIAVDEVEAYRRVRPGPDEGASIAMRRLFVERRPVVFIVTSSEGIAHLPTMVERSLAAVVDAAAARGWLVAATLLVPHRRIAETARKAGLVRVRLCGTGDRGILAAIE